MLQNHPHEHRTTAAEGFGLTGEHQQVLEDKLEQANNTNTLGILKDGLTEREIKKKQLHKVFRDSFDGKPIFSEKFLLQKLNYIHQNPVSGKWNLAKDFVSYEHSSASFYEDGIVGHFMPKHYKDL